MTDNRVWKCDMCLDIYSKKFKFKSVEGKKYCEDCYGLLITEDDYKDDEEQEDE